MSSNRQSPVLVHFNKRKHDYEATKRSFNNAIVKAREKLQAAQNEAKSANGKKDRYAASEREQLACKVQIFELNLKIAEAASNQASTFLFILNELADSQIESEHKQLISIINISENMMKKVHYRLVWQNNLETRTNWAELWTKLKSEYLKFFESIRELLLFSIGGVAIAAVTAAVIASILFFIFLPWAELISKVRVLFFNKGNTNTIWNSGLVKKIEEVTKLMKENTLSFSEIEKAFHTLQKSFSEFEKVVEEEECPVCFESYSPTFRPVRFNNQECRHMHCFDCATKTIQQKGICPSCSCAVTAELDLCTKCHEILDDVSHKRWDCELNHMCCERCAPGDRCPLCFNTKKKPLSLPKTII